MIEQTTKDWYCVCDNCGEKGRSHAGKPHGFKHQDIASWEPGWVAMRKTGEKEASHYCPECQLNALRWVFAKMNEEKTNRPDVTA